MPAKSTGRLGTFIASNRPLWSELEDLLKDFNKTKASKEELDNLGSIYRRVSAHLAYAQTYFPQHDVTHYLNGLVARAHNIIYGTSGKSDGLAIVRFFTRDFPNRFYERLRFFLIALLLFLTAGCFAFGSVMINPDYAYAFLPVEILESVDPHSVGQNQWDPHVASSYIMVNNIKVAFMCFAFGAVFGVGTVYVLIVNGFLLGALAAIFHRAGESYVFWAFIWPHGVIELTAIFIAGAAGLSLAYAFFVPGERTRMESYKQEGKVTVQLILGVVPLLVIAGIIEGYLTPAPWPHWSKYLIALGTLLFLMIYFGYPAWKKGVRHLTKEKRRDVPPLPTSNS